jgi:CrcB protein
MSIVSLALGGAAGGICRYLLGLKVTKTVSNPPFPVSMLFVNLLGAFGLGLFYGSYYGKVPSHAYDDSIFLMIGIGFFGAFTTFSILSENAGVCGDFSIGNSWFIYSRFTGRNVFI